MRNIEGLLNGREPPWGLGLSEGPLTRIGEFVDYYNTERYHESLNNVTPEDVYTGRGQTVLNRRRRIKQKSLAERRRLYYQRKAVSL